MLFKNKRTGEVVEFISREAERFDGLSKDDRVYFKECKLAEKYCCAYQWETEYEPLGEGSLCPCCGGIVPNVEAR